MSRMNCAKPQLAQARRGNVLEDVSIIAQIPKVTNQTYRASEKEYGLKKEERHSLLRRWLYGVCTEHVQKFHLIHNGEYWMDV